MNEVIVKLEGPPACGKSRLKRLLEHLLRAKGLIIEQTPNDHIFVVRIPKKIWQDGTVL